MIGLAIYSILSNDTDVSALVDDNIYPINAREGDSVPYITYQEISNVPANTKTGTSLLDMIRVQVSSFATRHEDAFSLAKKVRTALDNVTGVYADATFAVRVRQIDYDGEIDLGIDSAKVFERAQEFMIWCKEFIDGIAIMAIGTTFTIR